MKKNKDYTLLIIICVILICILGLLFLNKDEEDNVQDIPQYKLVNDYSDFFTVSSCVSKYITYLSNKNTDDLIKILDDEFVLENGINSNNVYNYVNKLSGNYTFKAKKMYYQVDDEKVIKYYVYGYLIEETINGIGTKQDYYLIVNLDTENQLFSVVPYNGELFKEGQ